MQTDQKFELIGGIVFMGSPAKRRHGRSTKLLVRWLDEYEEATPGTEAYDNTSNVLSDEDEPQPDACLVILPEQGGQTRDEGDWLAGPAELIGEIASSTESYDLHGKKHAYEKAGVKEYLVVVLRQKRVHWSINRQGQFVDLPVDAAGILRSETFPGLWLDPVALLANDRQRLLEVLRQGLATSEHAAFVARLAAKKGLE
jgi:Uma2 family endonuclease